MNPIANDLRQQGYSQTADFVSAGMIAALRNELNGLRTAGQFKRAGVGPVKAVNDQVRHDEVFWFHDPALSETQCKFLAPIDEIKNTINRELFLGLSHHEFHYAHYPAGGFYARHWDNLRGTGKRKISLALYLNQDWHEADGGQLRLYLPAGPVDVAPRAGTLICFLSEEIEHEVLESFAPRESVTGWFRTA